jgi:predicted nucleic acid-binding protein
LSIVLDSSVTLGWLYPDETTPAIQYVFDGAIRIGGWVPSLWRLEIANSLQMAARRNRVTEAFRDQSLADLELLPIRIDPETSHHAWGATLQFSATHRLTIYDAAYLELAVRRNFPLATLDADLRRAAGASGVKLLGV